mgnify:CR=1 FL=1
MWIWLSHQLRTETDGYRGVKSLSINHTSSIGNGDSSNSITFSMDNHLGTHVDVPYHFINDGLTINEYKPSDWVFNSPLIINKLLSPGVLLTPELMDKEISQCDEVDIILIKTGFEKYRGTEIYWENAPGYSSDLCELFLNKFKSLQAIGIDSISLSSLKHRQEGRKAHKKLLSNGIRIFEDLKLSQILPDKKLIKVIGLPLIIEGCDGGPCTILGEV